MNDNKVQFFKKGKYNTHIYNEYLLMKCSKNIKIRSYAKKKKLDGNCDDETNWT